MPNYSQKKADYPLLFQWAFDTFNKRLKNGVPPHRRVPALMVRLLSVEGVRDDLRRDELQDGVPKGLCYSLRCFRQLNQENRERRARKFLKEWSRCNA